MHFGNYYFYSLFTFVWVVLGKNHIYPLWCSNDVNFLELVFKLGSANGDKSGDLPTSQQSENDTSQKHFHASSF